MFREDPSKAQAYTLLAQLGKKVLRPGGKELTLRLIDRLTIQAGDDVVEFAPGLGFTAQLIIKKTPHSYLGIDHDKNTVLKLQRKFSENNIAFTLANVSNTGLEQGCKNKIVSEAMLTMHADHRKAEIIRESYRILQKGGLYAIHELSLKDVDTEQKADIQRNLSLISRVNTRPLTELEWKQLLMKEGFTIKEVLTGHMRLLEPQRIVADEGLLGALKILFRLLCNKAARKRVVAIRQAFQQYREQMQAIVIIAEKM